MNTDEHYMRLALALAQEAAEAGEVPVGAVVVSPSGAVVGRGRNMTQQLADVTAHAEMLALTAAAQYFDGKYLADCTLYVTLEPCTMCAGAIGWAQVGRLVYGAADPRRGYSTICRPERTPLHPRCTVTAGVLADECLARVRDFFARRRRPT